MGTLERYSPFFLEIHCTSRYITRFPDIDARRSVDGVEILERIRPFFFGDLLTLGYITKIVAQSRGDIQIENFTRPSAQFLTYKLAPRSPRV